MNLCQVGVCISWTTSLEHEEKEGLTLLQDSMCVLTSLQYGPFEIDCTIPYLLQ